MPTLVSMASKPAFFLHYCLDKLQTSIKYIHLRVQQLERTEKLKSSREPWPY